MNPEFARVAAWRDRLAKDRAGLVQAYLARPVATTLLSRLSRLTDRILADIWSTHELPARAALVAVGGYGRSELSRNPTSTSCCCRMTPCRRANALDSNRSSPCSGT